MQFFILVAVLLSASSVSCQVQSFDDPREEIFEDLQLNSEDVKEASAACQISIATDLGRPQPLYIRPGTEQFFHPSDRSRIISFALGQEIELFCSDDFTSPSGIAGNLIRISCLSGSRFMHNGMNYTFNEFSCRAWPRSVAQRRLTIHRCYNQGTIIDVGFQVANRFLKVFSVCHDPRLEQNYYTEYQLTPASAGHESNVANPGWRQEDFYPGKVVDDLLTRVTQRETIASILNSTSAAERFIELPNSQVFFARGHMAAKTDFISANEQRSTFFFVNTAPQWQTFNAGNWLSIEASSRNLASTRNIFLSVYTGTIGITQLRDDSGTNRQIFLDYANRQIPAPMLFYKVLVNRADQSGIVFLGVNNPHLTLSEIQANYVICNDVSHLVSYVTWQRDNLRRGYSYACEVNEFLRRVPHILDITVRSLLV